MTSRILSIVPADGDWVVVYPTRAQAYGRPWYTEPVALWALVEEVDDQGPCRYVMPMVGGEMVEVASDNYMGVYRRDQVDEELKEALDSEATALLAAGA